VLPYGPLRLGKNFTLLVLVMFCLLVTECSYRGWLAGHQMALDTAKTAKSLMSQSNFAIGYSKDDLTLHTSV